MHFCGEELAALLALVPCCGLLAARFKVWWHIRHLQKPHDNCPHDHKHCLPPEGA
jgi:hypothetical protein